MLDILLESASPTPRPNRATVFSIVIHSALIVVFLAAREGYREQTNSVEREDVRYLIPINRVKAPRPEQVPTHWRGLGLIGEGTGVDAQLREGEALTGEPPSGRTKSLEVTTALAPSIMYDTVASAIDVDSVARVVQSAAPAYPTELLARNVEGRTVVQFVVDTLGLVDTVSFAVIETTHAEFAQAVRAVLPAMRFTPATIASRKVRQRVQQPFQFKIVPSVQNTARADSVS